MLRFTATILTVTCFFFSVHGQANAQPISCERLLPQMQRDHIDSVAAAFSDRGRQRKLFCSASGKVLSGDAVFEAASLSKPIFAAGVLKLVQEHKLDLDRPLSQYLREPYRHRQDTFGDGPTDEVADPRFALITARMVLSHTSGLPNWARLRPLTLQSDPGRRWSYSGEGYIYLQRVVEEITKTPLDVFLREIVLLPIGMEHSSFVWLPSLEESALPGYSAAGVASPIAQFKTPLASSTLYTTLNDYAQFVARMLDPTNGSTFSMEEQSQVVVRPDLALAWGLGVAIERTKRRAYFHWGSSPGFQSFFMCQPATRRSVLFLTNSDNGLALVDTFVHAGIPGPHPILRFKMLHPRD